MTLGLFRSETCKSRYSAVVLRDVWFVFVTAVEDEDPGFRLNSSSPAGLLWRLKSRHCVSSKWKRLENTWEEGVESNRQSKDECSSRQDIVRVNWWRFRDYYV